jgi:nitrite reductase/ring-hydroxylating ferredoxin subunit
MLREDNDLLMHVGAGTPFGDMLRRYWHPIAMSSQVAEPDGPPLRTKLLGEPFVVFRDTQGRVGVLDEYCMHRGASLALGRNEEGGLRCIYHGWKFDVDGAILETPNHADCRFRENTKAPAYPVREQSGLVWAYIGPKELEPPFRSFEFDTVPEANRVLAWTVPTWASCTQTSCGPLGAQASAARPTTRRIFGIAWLQTTRSRTRISDTTTAPSATSRASKAGAMPD